MSGVVYLVGAGPGDPELITVKGLRCLQQAEVVIYDELANPALLAHAPAGCELIGLHGHHKEQAAINALLVERARPGRCVVRLKGGDPFVFGRGGEEAQYLAAAGVPFVVVPGITSAVAAPACAGIPVTHRGVAASVLVVTGHETSGKLQSQVDWACAARAADTLVILMVMANLPAITAALLQAGKPADTPVAIVSRGSLPEQVVLVSPLADVAQAAAAANIQSPAVVVVGEVVCLRQRIAFAHHEPVWLESRASDT